MSDATFDAVIIGAGHNGTGARRLSREGGMGVGVFEKRAEEGGGLCTEELTRPGFLHNVHANYHTLVGICPVYDDLELTSRMGCAMCNRQCKWRACSTTGPRWWCILISTRPATSIARFSRKDADTFHAVYEEARGYRDLILRTLMYSPRSPSRT